MYVLPTCDGGKRQPLILDRQSKLTTRPKKGGPKEFFLGEAGKKKRRGTTEGK